MLRSLFNPDERFVTHRFYSTRLAMVVGIVLIALWFNYEWFVNDHLRVDLAVIAGAMALTKIVAMLYYQYVR